MDINSTIKTLMKSKSITQKDLTALTGLKTQGQVSQYLQRELRCTVALKFLKAMNCTLQVVDNETGEVYEVTAE